MARNRARPPGETPGAGREDHEGSGRRQASPTLAYLAARERTLGRRVAIPTCDAEAAAEAVAEALGGWQLARNYVLQLVDELDAAGVVADRQCDHPRCAVCRGVEVATG